MLTRLGTMAISSRSTATATPMAPVFRMLAADIIPTALSSPLKIAPLPIPSRRCRKPRITYCVPCAIASNRCPGLQEGTFRRWGGNGSQPLGSVRIWCPVRFRPHRSSTGTSPFPAAPGRNFLGLPWADPFLPKGIHRHFCETFFGNHRGIRNGIFSSASSAGTFRLRTELHTRR